MTSHGNAGSNRHDVRGGRPDQLAVDLAPSRPVVVVLLGLVLLSVSRQRLKFLDFRRRLPGLRASANGAQILSLRRLAFLRRSGVGKYSNHRRRYPGRLAAAIIGCPSLAP